MTGDKDSPAKFEKQAPRGGISAEFALGFLDSFYSPGFWEADEELNRRLCSIFPLIEEFPALWGAGGGHVLALLRFQAQQRGLEPYGVRNLRADEHLKADRNGHRKLKGSERNEVFCKTRGHCWYCGKKLGRLFVVEHPNEESREPINGVDPNLALLLPSCVSCNSQKHKRNLEEYRELLSSGARHLFWGEQNGY